MPLRRERLGPLDQSLLARARVAVRRVELGEERLAVRLDRRASRPEPLPELVALVLGQARSVLLLRLPAGEQLVELRGDLLPLRLRRILRGEGLDLGDEGLALDEGGRGGLLRLGGLLLGELADAALQLLEPGVERLEVADGVRGRHGLAQRGDRLGDIVGRRAAADPLLEQADLARELRVLALEVGERLFGGRIRILADGALAVRLAHVHRAVVVDTTPGGRCLAVLCLIALCLIALCH